MKRKLLVVAGTLAASAMLVSAAAAGSAPSVRTGGVSSVSHTSAVLRATVNPNGASTTYYFQWGLTASYGSNTSPRSAGHGVKAVSVARTATPLAPGTIYHYRVVATNQFGSSFGVDRTFKTGGHPPPGVITGAAGRVGTTDATLLGVVYPGTKPTSWYFQFGTSTAYAYRTAAQVVSPVSPSNKGVPVSYTLTGLAPGTIIHFRIVGAHSGEASVVGADAAFMTYPSPRPQPGISASTSPHRSRRGPYRFTSSGDLTPPSSIPDQYGCNGNVTIRFFRGLRQVGFTLAGIQPNCTFSAQTVFNRIPGGRKNRNPVPLRVVIRSISNNYLATNRASIEHIKLG
jgi:hypothetical protein